MAREGLPPGAACPPENFPVGKVQRVRQQWSVHEDGALAYHLQNEEITGKVNFNRAQRQTVRQDVSIAKRTQEELEQEARFKEMETKIQREEDDARIAAEIHQRILIEETQRQTAQNLRDEEYAKALQAKEEKRYQRYLEKKRDKEAEKKREKEAEREHRRAEGGQAVCGDEEVEALTAEAERMRLGATAEADQDVVVVGGARGDSRGAADVPRRQPSRERKERAAEKRRSRGDPADAVARPEVELSRSRPLSEVSHSRSHSGLSQVSSPLSDFSFEGCDTRELVDQRQRMELEAKDAALARALQEEEKKRARKNRERRREGGRERSDRSARSIETRSQSISNFDDGPPPGYEDSHALSERGGDPLRYTPDPESPIDLPSSLAAAPSGFVRQSFAAAVGGGAVVSTAPQTSGLPTSPSSASSFLDDTSSRGRDGDVSTDSEAPTSARHSFEEERLHLRPALQPLVEAPLTPKSQRARIKLLPSLSSPAQVRRLTTMNGTMEISTDENFSCQSDDAKVTHWVDGAAGISAVDNSFSEGDFVEVGSGRFIERCSSSDAHHPFRRTGPFRPPPGPSLPPCSPRAVHSSETDVSLATSPSTHSSATSCTNHALFRPNGHSALSKQNPPSSPPTVNLPAYPNARPSSLYGGVSISASPSASPASPSSRHAGNGAASATTSGFCSGASRPASVYQTHTSSSSDRCSTPDKDVEKNAGLFSRNRRNGSSKKKSPATGRHRNSVVLLGGATEDQNGMLKIQSPVNCINVAMAIDPTYQRRLRKGEFNASSPASDICRVADFSPDGLSSGDSLDRLCRDISFSATSATTEDDFSPSSVPAYARDPRLSQDLSAIFPPVSPRLSCAWPSSGGSGGRSNGGSEHPPASAARPQQRISIAPSSGDPFVEEVDWEDEDVEPPPMMLVRGTKRSTLQQSQAHAVANSLAKENGGKGTKKKDRNACKPQ